MSTSSSRPCLHQKVILYTRVSTQDQGDNGVGLRLQEIQSEEFARAEGLMIVERFSDTGTGKETHRQRDGLVRALKSAEQNKRPILVASLDRLTRNKEFAARLVAMGIRIISASDDASASPAVVAGKFARAEEEVRIISERTKAALARKKAAGVRLGNPKNLPEARRRGSEQNRRAARRRDSRLADDIEALGLPANATVKQIALALRKQGRLTPRGLPYTAENLYRRLRKMRPLPPTASTAAAPTPEPEPGPSASDLANKNWGMF